MAQKKPNQRIVKEKLAQATELAKKGQYQKARYLLQDISSEPKAQRLIKQMEGRNDKLQGGISYFYSGTLIAMVVLIGIVLFWIWNSVQGVRNEVDARAAVSNSFAERGLSGNRNMYVDLVYFCYERNGGVDRPECLDWAEYVTREQSDQVIGCVIVSDNGLEYRNQTRDDVASCFTTIGIPDPVAYQPGAESTDG